MEIRPAAAERVSGQIINVASGSRTGVNELVNVIAKCLARHIDVQYEEPHVGDIRDSWADVSRARELLGFTPMVDLKRGIDLTIAAFEGPVRSWREQSLQGKIAA